MVIKGQLDKLKVGLETLRVLELIQNHPIKMRSLFVVYHYHLTSDMMQDVESEFAQQLN